MKNIPTLQLAIFRNSSGANAELSEIVLMLKEALRDKKVTAEQKKIIGKDYRNLISIIKQVRDLHIMQNFYQVPSPSEAEIENSLFSLLKTT
jgi:hypothetical protein